jgi:hypothetical protein
VSAADRPHVCESCGRACGACAEAAAAGQPLPHNIREPWCPWCARIYADNAPDPDTGRVHCQRCDAPFPALAAFIAAGLEKYPRYCRKCRPWAEGRDEREATRVAAKIATRTPPPPAITAPATKPDPAITAEIEHERRWARGGFVPRVGPDTTETELGGVGVEWPGTRNGRVRL